MKERKILVMEDDAGLNRGICFFLERDGCHVISCDTVARGWRLYREEAPDMILLDLNFPDGDGLDFCRRVREESTLPILMLTARDMETDEILGLESGANDYVKKPFSLAVLKARIERIFREKEEKREFTLRAGGITLYPEQMRAEKDGCEITLSTTEYRLLKYLMENKGQVLLKEQLLSRLWDEKGNFVEENTLMVTISRLRRKLENDPSNPDYIKTIHGMGYLFYEKN
ncbi:response regulator transcription factor [Anaerolentibacter hominis]|uniref:response regulator transcription factor n=1 Tax=Anaerolentibacter hominis TaxID=3079009 RepID=UPI0031B899D3